MEQANLYRDVDQRIELDHKKYTRYYRWVGALRQFSEKRIDGFICPSDNPYDNTAYTMVVLTTGRDSRPLPVTLMKSRTVGFFLPLPAMA